MGPHQRIRKTVKWGGGAAMLVLLGVWIASGWYWIGWYFPRAAVGLYVGRLLIEAEGGPPHPPDDNVGPRIWYMGRPEPPRWTWSYFRETNRYGLMLAIPLWMPAVPVLLATGAAWRLDAVARRRERAGRCPKCSYDLSGLGAGAACPECGAGARA